MADFSYTAINKEGKQVKGSIKANNDTDARAQLKKEGLKPITVKGQSVLTKDIDLGIETKVKTRDLSVFCRQFSSILGAGVTVVDGLRMLADQTENKTLKKALNLTRESVQQGLSLAEAMKRSPKVFDEMFVNMVDAGEQSGSLEVCIDRLGKQYEKTAKLTGQVKSAMIYPIAVLVIALGVTLFMSIKVIPEFAGMFEQMGTELPLPTKIVMAFSDLIMSKWWLLIIIVVGLIVVLKLFGTTTAGKKAYGKLAIHAPIFGDLSIKSNSARFSRTMSTLVSSGMSITTALEITGRAMSNIWYKLALQKAKTEVEQGMPLSAPIRQEDEIFPPMVHNMLAIGEETGNIEHMLDKVADYYEEETEVKTKNLTELMQPIMIVILGGIIGLMVLAMYSPMIGMYGDMGNL